MIELWMSSMIYYDDSTASMDYKIQVVSILYFQLTKIKLLPQIFQEIN